MAVELMTFSGKPLTPKDHAIMREKNQVDGVLYGCELTHLGSNQVQISAGSISVRGRQVNVLQETILCELASSGTMDGRIYLKIDLADATTPAALLTVAATTLPDLVQDDDFNTTNGVWEMELGLYTASTTLISDLTTTYKTSVEVGNSDISSIGDGTILGAISSLSGGTGGTVLWTNSSPTSSFAAQTVTLLETIENYDYYEVEFFQSNTLNDIMFTTGKIASNRRTALFASTSATGIAYRALQSVPSGTSIIFSSGSTSNAAAIPYRILGYKTK